MEVQLIGIGRCNIKEMRIFKKILKQKYDSH